MTVQELCGHLGCTLAAGAEGADREITGIYCCDLLSIAMGRAPADSAWLTVMGNVNAVAVAALADVSCIVLCEGMPLDEDAKARADEQGIAVLRTPAPIYETAIAASQGM